MLRAASLAGYLPALAAITCIFGSAVQPARAQEVPGLPCEIYKTQEPPGESDVPADQKNARLLLPDVWPDGLPKLWPDDETKVAGLLPWHASWQDRRTPPLAHATTA